MTDADNVDNGGGENLHKNGDDVSYSSEGADTRGGRGAVDHEEDEELCGRAEERLQVAHHPDLPPDNVGGQVVGLQDAEGEDEGCGQQGHQGGHRAL